MNLSYTLPALFALALPLPCDAGLQAGDPTSPGLNYDEAMVDNYTLPDPLLTRDGRRITPTDEWNPLRRDEILHDFSDLMYGHTPKLPVKLRAETTATRQDAVDGLATRTLVTLRFFDAPDAPQIQLMLYVPNHAKQPTPVFLGL